MTAGIVAGCEDITRVDTYAVCGTPTRDDAQGRTASLRPEAIDSKAL